MSETSGNTAGVLEPTTSVSTQSVQALNAGTPREARRELPEDPLVTIQPGKGWGALDLGDVWTYRELLYFLIWRDVKVRYKQTALGVAWVLLQPLLMTLIFTVFLGMLARVPTGGIPYPLMVYVGLLPWTFFSGAVATGGMSLVGNANLITKIYFPRLLIPASAVGSRLVDFAVAFVILIGLTLYYHDSVSVTWGILMLPPLIVLVTLLALGFGLLTSALNVKYRDIGVALPVLIQLWMFVSPVLYPASLVRQNIPQKWWLVYALNPLVGIVGGFRAALIGQDFDWPALAISAVFTAAMLLLSSFLFRRVEKSFADVI